MSSKVESTSYNILNLPDELLVKILDYSISDESSISKIQEICKKFYALMNDFSINLPWNAICTINNYSEKDPTINFKNSSITSISKRMKFPVLSYPQRIEITSKYFKARLEWSVPPWPEEEVIKRFIEDPIQPDDKLKDADKIPFIIMMKIKYIKFLTKKGKKDKAIELFNLVKDETCNRPYKYHVPKDIVEYVKAGVLLNKTDDMLTFLNTFYEYDFKPKIAIIKTLIKNNKLDYLENVLDSKIRIIANFELIKYYFQKTEIEKAITQLDEILIIYENIEYYEKDKHLFMCIKYLLKYEKIDKAFECIQYLKEPYYIDKTKLELIKFYLKKNDLSQVQKLLDEITFTKLQYKAYLECARVFPENETIRKKLLLIFSKTIDKAQFLKNYIKVLPLDKHINLPKCTPELPGSFSWSHEIDKAKLKHVKELLQSKEILKAARLIDTMNNFSDPYLYELAQIKMIKQLTQISAS